MAALDEVPLVAGVLAPPALVALLVEELLAPPTAFASDEAAAVVVLAVVMAAVDAAGVALAPAPIVAGLLAGAAFASNNCALVSP